MKQIYDAWVSNEFRITVKLICSCCGHMGESEDIKDTYYLGTNRTLGSMVYLYNSDILVMEGFWFCRKCADEIVDLVESCGVCISIQKIDNTNRLGEMYKGIIKNTGFNESKLECAVRGLLEYGPKEEGC